MPFNIYAETNYPTLTYNSSSINSDWISKGGNVSNYCDDPTGTGKPCKLNFTFNDSYYGYVLFRGGFGTSYRNNLVVRITAGQGYYEYNTISSSPYQMTNVRIDGIYLSLSNNVDLQPIIDQLVIANGYLADDTYTFPIESYTSVEYVIRQGYEVTSFKSLGNYMYPVFLSSTNGYVVNTNLSQPLHIVMWTNANIWGLSKFDEYFTYGGTAQNFKVIYGASWSYLFEVDLVNGSSSVFSELKWKQNGYEFIPIYTYEKNLKNISTDFALLFDMDNRLLDLLNQIANGTSGSSSAASDLEDSNDQMADDMNDLATIENGYNQNFNDQLENIDFTNPIQSNQGILPAANFVISVFNGLISNNPFSLLIIVCCILLIGKKVIGK